MANPPVGKGNLITAEQFNEMVSSYNVLWSDTAPTADFANIITERDIHNRGWGQATAEPVVSIEEIITAEHTNRLIAQMNAGLYHYSDTPELITHFSKEASIIADHVQTIVIDKVSEMDTNRFSINSIDADIDIAVVTDAATPIWENSVYAIAKATFTDYNEARYFFNSGGKITINLEATGGDQPSLEWDGIFNSAGEIRIGAMEINDTGPHTEITSGGFYHINPDGSYTTLYTMTGFATGGSYGGYGGYSNRRIDVQLAAVDGVTFDVFVKVILTDDITSDIVNTTLTADYGHINQLETPNDVFMASGSISAPFRAGIYSYQFQERQKPTLSIDTSWTVIS